MDNKTKGILTVAVIAGTIGLVIASKAKAAPPVTPGLANLSGVVTDSETNLPIAGVSITFDGHSTITNNNGAYAFIDMEPGNYTVMFSKSGYQAVSY